VAEDRQDPLRVMGTTPEDEPTGHRNEHPPTDSRTADTARGSEDKGDAPAGVAAGSWVPLVIALTVGVLIALGIAISWLL
jgi:hypothetical protein